MVHIVDDVLLPAKGDEKKQEAPVFARMDRALEAANLSTLAAAIEVRGRCSSKNTYTAFSNACSRLPTS
jgi:hypothetical protein